MSSEQSITYQKEKFTRIGFWLVAIILISVAAWFFSNFFNNNVASVVPNNYKFMLVDHYTKDTDNWATYYVYDNQILVKKDSAPDATTTEYPIMAYDGVNTAELEYDESSTTRVCDSDSCYSCPKALVEVRKLIANHYGREYIGH